MRWLDKIPIAPIAVVAIFLAFAPFVPQPHLLEKIQMLFSGTLNKPVDIFDLFWHSWPIVIIVLKVIRIQQLKKGVT